MEPLTIAIGTTGPKFLRRVTFAAEDPQAMATENIPLKHLLAAYFDGNVGEGELEDPDDEDQAP